MLFCRLDISYDPNSACTTGGQSTLRCLVISEYRLHALIRAPVGILLEHSFINATSSSNDLLNREFVMTQVTMTVVAGSDIEILCRPCVDCGRKTGCYCDNCKAKDRVPSEEWADHQQTPLCTYCDRKYDECHFCRGLHWCTPFEHDVVTTGDTSSSRSHTATEHATPLNTNTATEHVTSPALGPTLGNEKEKIIQPWEAQGSGVLQEFRSSRSTATQHADAQ